MSELERLASERGLRINAKRQPILRVLDEADGPLSAREVHARALRLGRRVSLPSVYLTLHALVACGLLTAVSSPHRTMVLYRKIGAPHVEQLIDVRSGHVRDFRSAGMQSLLEETARGLGYQLLDYRVELYGIADCAGPAANAGSRRQRSRAATRPAAGSGTARATVSCRLPADAARRATETDSTPKE